LFFVCLSTGQVKWRQSCHFKKDGSKKKKKKKRKKGERRMVGSEANPSLALQLDLPDLRWKERLNDFFYFCSTKKSV
jgi:hypothetical protein